MKVKPLDLRNKKCWNMIHSTIPVYLLEDYAKVERLIKPQEQNEHKVLHPDCAFLFAQSNTYFFAVNVAMDMKGYYRFGYALYQPESGTGCYPSSRWKDHKKSTTLKGCLLNSLEYIKAWPDKNGHPVYRLYAAKASEAIDRLKKSSVLQPSLFDLID